MKPGRLSRFRVFEACEKLRDFRLDLWKCRARPNYNMKVEKMVLGWVQCSAALEDVSRGLARMPAGGEIQVIFSNRDFAIDLAAWCHGMGHRIVETGMHGEDYYFVIRKADS